MGRGGDGVTEKNQGAAGALFRPADLHHLVAVGVAVAHQQLDAWGNLLPRRQDFQPAVVLQWHEVVGDEGGPVLRAGVVGQVPLGLLRIVGGLGKGRYPFVAVLDGGAAGVVEMEMGQDHIGHRLGAEANRGQGRLQRVFRLPEGKHVALFIAPLAAHARIHQYQPALPFDEQMAQGQFDAVGLIGGIGPLPQRLGHGAEHGAAVQAKAPRLQQVDGPGGDGEGVRHADELLLACAQFDTYGLCGAITRAYSYLSLSISLISSVTILAFPTN